ncbi:hypothetical protein D3C80_1915690 [compost metagenome]
MLFGNSIAWPKIVRQYKVMNIVMPETPTSMPPHHNSMIAAVANATMLVPTCINRLPPKRATVRFTVIAPVK